VPLLTADRQRSREGTQLAPAPVAEPTGGPLLAAELSLFLVTVSVVCGMARLFVDLDYLDTVAVAAVGAHLLAAVLRRLRLGTLTSLAISGVGLVLAVCWLVYPATAWYLLPTASTWDVLTADLSAAWDAFGLVRAPVEALPGFVVGATAAVWVAATLSDLAAFRARSVVEALVPPGAIFFFVAVLGEERNRLASAIAFLAAALLFVLAYRIAYPPDRSVPVGAALQRRSGALARAGFGLAVAAVAVGLLVGPLLPGAEANPVVNLRELDGTGGGSSRITLSPLVDTRGRLVSQSETIVFRVESNLPAFWRTTALDTFDGAVWGSQNTYDVASGTLTAAEQPVSGERVNQTFTIEALGDIWLPAAYTPLSIDGVGSRWDGDSSTLIVRDDRTTPGLTYSVTSLSPTTSFSPEELLAAAETVPPDLLARYTALPDDFDPRITELAQEITAGLQTTYERALALQNWFLTQFQYSTDVATGHGTDRMARFLLEERVGYCEQFAGSFAAMARTLGIPSRVATGFTPGDLVDGQYVVRGEHYHAWPEVYMAERWVYFEPTPGRGAPGAESYTGVPEQQVQNQDLTSTTLAGGGAIGATVPDIALEGLVDFPNEAGGDGDLSGDDTVPVLFRRILIALAIVAALGTAWWIGVPLLARLRRRRRHDAARTAAQDVEASWLDLTESLAAAGVPSDPSETPREYADRAYRQTSVRREQMAEMARVVTASRYGAEAPDDAVAAHAAALVRDLETELRDATEPRERWRRRIDPRPLLRR
jgi:transglutaminase-like putative cysteine protease